MQIILTYGATNRIVQGCGSWRLKTHLMNTGRRDADAKPCEGKFMVLVIVDLYAP
jgi:hypothetical protein